MEDVTVRGHEALDVAPMVHRSHATRRVMYSSISARAGACSRMNCSPPRPPQSRTEIHDRLAPAHEARTSFEWNPDHLGDDHHRQRTGEVGDEIHFASWTCSSRRLCASSRIRDAAQNHLPHRLAHDGAEITTRGAGVGHGARHHDSFDSVGQATRYSTSRLRRCGRTSASRQSARSCSSDSRCQSAGIGASRRRAPLDSNASHPAARRGVSAMRMPRTRRRSPSLRSRVSAGPGAPVDRRSPCRRSPHEGTTSHALHSWSSSSRKLRCGDITYVFGTHRAMSVIKLTNTILPTRFS
jgi:hypothetical protein